MLHQIKALKHERFKAFSFFINHIGSLAGQYLVEEREVEQKISFQHLLFEETVLFHFLHERMILRK